MHRLKKQSDFQNQFKTISKKSLSSSKTYTLFHYHQFNQQFVELEPSYFPSDKLLNYINKESPFEIHFTVLGNNGYRAQLEKKTFFGRLVEELVLKARSNMIVIT